MNFPLLPESISDEFQSCSYVAFAHHPPFGSSAGGSVLTKSKKIHCSTPCAEICFAEMWAFLNAEPPE